MKKAVDHVEDKLRKKPLYHWSRLIEARVPLGFVMHMGANYLLENFPLSLQVPLIFLVWWELAKEFPNKGLIIQIGMTFIQLIELYIINTYPAVFLAFSPLQVASIQFAVFFAIIFGFGARNLDNIIINYLLFGVTFVNLIIQQYPPVVMLTISMAIAGSDCVQYFAGKRYGKTKIVPKISPNKSLEGYIAAMIGCNLVNFWLVGGIPTFYNLAFVNMVLLAGIFGDLFISWWKRNHHIKDTSHLLTGHGGFLDRLDSHIGAWIATYVFLTIFGGLPGTNFTQMDYGKIEILIYLSWIAVWARFFYCAVVKGELI